MCTTCICTKSGVTEIWEDCYYIVAVSHENVWFEWTDEVSSFTETNLGNSGPYPNWEWNSQVISDHFTTQCAAVQSFYTYYYDISSNEINE